MTSSDGGAMAESDGGEATQRPWLTLDPEETVRWAGQPRIQSTIPAVGLAVLVAVGALAIPGVPTVLRVAGIAVGGAIGAGAVLWVRSIEYVVTTDALYRKRGVLGQRVEQVPLEKVQNSSFGQHPLGAVLGYGNVTFDTAGGAPTGAEMAFRNIENPDAVRRLVDAAVADASEDDIPGSLEQWEAVLAEVRRLRAAVETSSEW